MHIVVGNERHPAIIHSLIVGRTKSGAKGTGLAVVEAIRRAHRLGSMSSLHRGCPAPDALFEQVRYLYGNLENKEYDSVRSTNGC